ncbi:MAG: TonB-dependent receptor [Bryobacteraceae bacterium]|nr:TonB-dependent receptor [Bryobacteraceae bacterium]
MRVVLVTMLTACLLSAQGTVTIFGTVTDPGGAAIPGVSVTASNKETGVSRKANTGAAGDYVISRLPIGTYSVTAESAGFKTAVQDNIQVQVDENRQVSIAMTIGAVNESITVQAESTQVETRSGALKEVIDSARIVQLPLNGRNPLQLQYLVAGSGGVVSAGQEQNDSVSINGSRPNTNNYTLDGADNHDPYFNTPAVFPNPDALEEFSLQTSAYSADRGRNAGAIMNAVTRSGTNQFHGTAFEFLRNEKLNARNFFANTIPPFKRNQFGGTFGGPVRRDKTFFFGSYQRTSERSSPGALNPTVLTAAERRGDWSNSGLRTPLRDPLGGTFPNNIIPLSRLSQPAQKFLEAFVPLPNRGVNQFSFASQQKIDDDQAVTRIDHTLTENNRLSGRLLWNSNDNYQSANNVTLPGFLALIQYRNWSVAVTDTHLISGSVVNTFTFGFNKIDRDQVPVVPGNKGWHDFGAGFVRAYPDDPIVGFDTNVAGYFQPQARYPLHHYRKNIQLSENLSWTIGQHFLRIGGDVRINRLRLQENFQTDPQIAFQATFTGVSAADLLLGLPTSFTQIAPDQNRPRTNEFSAFVQDDWKVSRRLTLNLGLRWDPFLPFTDPDNRFAQVRFGQQSTVFPAAPRGYVFPGDTGVSDATYEKQLGNWGPRFGFAFDPTGKGKTSVRGGYGVFYSQIRQQANNQISNNQPFSIKLTVQNPSGGLERPYADSGNPFPFKAPSTREETTAYKFLLPLNVTQWNPDMRNALSQQWNFTLQQELKGFVLTSAYVGSKGNHLFVQNELNPAVFGAAGRTVDARRIYAPTFTSITDYSATGNSTYHALQLTANRRLSKGLTVLANYTWSKYLDTGSGDGAVPQNPFDRNSEKAVSNQDVPHRFVGSFIYQFPGLRSMPKVVQHVAGGWEINGIVTLNSGGPFGVTSGRDNSGTALNQDRPNVVGDWRLSEDRSKAEKISQFFNSAAFAQNPAGTFGNAGRNIMRAEFRENFDIGAIKNFSLVEKHRLQFRAEFFNLFNHANLGAPNGNVANLNFGKILTAGSPRVVQVALKYMF